MSIEKISNQSLDSSLLMEELLRQETLKSAAKKSQVTKENTKETTETKETKQAEETPNYGTLEKVFSKLGNVLSSDVVAEAEEDFNILSIGDGDGISALDAGSLIFKAVSMMGISDKLVKAASTSLGLSTLSGATKLLGSTGILSEEQVNMLSNLDPATLNLLFNPTAALESTTPTSAASATSTGTIEMAMCGLANAASMESLVNGLVSRADLLSQLLAIIPENLQGDAMIELIQKMLGVLKALGIDMDDLAKAIEAKKSKSEYTMKPDANKKEEGVTASMDIT